MCEEGALQLEMGPLLCWALCSLVAILEPQKQSPHPGQPLPDPGLQIPLSQPDLGAHPPSTPKEPKGEHNKR